MSVLYDTEPGRLEVYRPRADGLMGRSFCGSVLVHLLFAAVLLTVRFPAPKPPPPRRYRITQITLLPPRPAPEENPQAPQPPAPKDLSLFLNDVVPRPAASHRTRHRRRTRRTLRHRNSAPMMPAADTVAREVKPEAPEPGDVRRSRLGPELAEGLPKLLERPMVDRHPVEPAPPETPGAAAAPPAPRTPARPKRAAAPRRVVAHRVVPAPRRAESGDHREPAPAPKMVVVARAERARPLSDLLPRMSEPAGPAVPAAVPPLPAAAPPSLSSDRPAELPAERSGSGKRMAQLPGDLFGSGSGSGPAPSHRVTSLPEGRPGAAQVPGPRRPRVTRGRVGKSPSTGGGELDGIDPALNPGGVRLHEDDRPGTLKPGASADLGDFGGKDTPVASLPSMGAEAPGSGSGAAPHGGGAGGGYGADAPRSFGGGNRAGRPASLPHERTASAGDGTGALGAGVNSGIAIPGAGATGGGAGTRSDGSNRSGDGPGRGTRGKRIARAELPADGDGTGGRGASNGPGAAPSLPTGPRSFGDTDRHSVTAPSGEGAGRGKGKGSSNGNGDGDDSGVSLPSGGGSNDDPGQDAGTGDADSGFHKGRTRPAGVYVSTTGRFTLPGAIYNGDYNYNRHVLLQILDEVNTATKKGVHLTLKYESIAPGSFQNAPVVVFTGHKAFELTEDQRQVLKDYVAHGGMIWADFSHSSRPNFDDSFRNEMEKTFGSDPVPLSASHPIYHSFYVLHGVPPGESGADAPFEGITVGGHLGVLITQNRYMSAVGGSLNTTSEEHDSAVQAVVNIYMYAAGNYRAAKDAAD